MIVPSDWEVKSLEDVVSKTRKITYGIVVPGPNTPNGNLMIRAQDYSFGWKDIDSVYRVSDEVHNSYKRSQVEEGDVLLTIVGSIGKTAVVPRHFSGANLTQQTARLSFNENNGSYFHAVLSSSIGQREVYRFAKSGVQPSLNLSDIAKFQVPAPPLHEQKKIAQILSTWDKAINTTEQLLANSQQQKKALMQQLLTGKKRLLDKNGLRFNGEWKEYNLEDVFSFKKGKGLSKADLSDSGSNKCILYGELYTRYTEVVKTVFSRTNQTDGTPSVSGDILIPSSTTTSGIDLANATALLEDNVLLGGDINILRPKKKIAASFFSHLLTHIKKYDIASRTQGITIIHLYSSDLKDIKILIPIELIEQQKIAAVLSTADQEISALQQKLDALKQEKKALMQQLLTGKRRVIFN